MKKPLKPNPRLLEVLRALTPIKRKRLATLAKTTPGSLRQYAEGHRGISSDLAIRIEKAGAKLGKSVKINRMDLSPVCAQCEYAIKCRGAG